MLFHNSRDHVNESTMVCRWPSCDGTLRSRWSLVTHLQDHHCNEHILREATRKRHELGQSAYMEQIKQLLEQTKEVSHHPGYSKHAAFEAIRRHAFNFMQKDLTVGFELKEQGIVFFRMISKGRSQKAFDWLAV